jgi:hypothetical protein
LRRGDGDEPSLLPIPASTALSSRFQNRAQRTQLDDATCGDDPSQLLHCMSAPAGQARCSWADWAGCGGRQSASFSEHVDEPQRAASPASDWEGLRRDQAIHGASGDRGDGFDPPLPSDSLGALHVTARHPCQHHEPPTSWADTIASMHVTKVMSVSVLGLVLGVVAGGDANSTTPCRA